MRKWRLHIIGLSAIIAIVVVMFWATGALNEPQTTGPNIGGDNRFTGGRFIQIVEASWGLSCNRAIENHNRRVDEAERDFSRSDEVPDRIEPVQKNNALLSLSRMCDGRKTCALEKVKTSEIGLEPLDVRCTKSLDIRYRCFEIDGIRELSVRQNKPLRIDCREEGEG